MLGLTFTVLGYAVTNDPTLYSLSIIILFCKHSKVMSRRQRQALRGVPCALCAAQGRRPEPGRQGLRLWPRRLPTPPVQPPHPCHSACALIKIFFPLYSTHGLLCWFNYLNIEILEPRHQEGQQRLVGRAYVKGSIAGAVPFRVALQDFTPWGRRGRGCTSGRGRSRRRSLPGSYGAAGRASPPTVRFPGWCCFPWGIPACSRDI